MNFSIDRSPLLEALQTVQTVVEKKNTIQILGNVLCSVKDQELSLYATDLEVGIKISMAVESQSEGRITLPAKNFLDIVKELPDKKLYITKKDNHWVELVCGKSKFNIVGLSADQYPALPTFEDKKYFEGRTDSLIDMIDRTQFAASTDAARYHINGVFFEYLENQLMRMTATDGHRLSFVDHEVFLHSPDLKRGVIIPKKGLAELRKLISSGDEKVGLSFERGYIFARLNSTFLFVKLIEGEYPDYRPVIPKTVDRVVKLNRTEFNSALKRVSLLANEKSRGIKLGLQPGLLIISSSNSDMGEAREEIDVEYTGESMEVGFNSKYLLECLSVMTADHLEFHLKDRLSPGILKEVGQESHTYVIMPMRI
jgi:DNA polymerase III subunit beta